MAYRYDGTVKVFKAFTDVNRLAIIEMLLNGEMCSCEILEHTTIGQSTLSHHMKILTDSGIVIARKDGKWVHYSISENGTIIAKRLIDYYTTFNTNTALNACDCEKEGKFHMGLFGNKKNPDAKSSSVPGASVKVLGTGCKKCDDFMQETEKALSELDMNTDIEHVTDLSKIVAYGVMSTPSLVVDDKVVSMGKVLKKEAIIKILKEVRG